MAGQRRTLADPLLPLAGAQAVTAQRTGPKAATLARLRLAGLPVPDAFCVAADVYRSHLSAAGLEHAEGRVAHTAEPEAGRLARGVRLGLLRARLPAGVEEALHAAYQRLSAQLGPLVAVRSSALSEDTPVASFAGQLETILGVANNADLVTAVRACWASLWSPRAARYAKARGVDPARTAVAVLVQRLVPARVAGGALSRTSDGHLVVTASWGLGPAVAQGALVPDRYLLRRDGPVLEGMEPGCKTQLLSCSAAGDLRWQAVASELVTAPCLSEAEAVTLARLALAAEALLRSTVEIEWALDDEGFWILQARPLVVEPRRTGNRLWLGDPALTGQPAGSGSAAGPARVVRSEAELARVGVGDVLVTRVPGPALAAVLPRVAGVVAELGGSTSHLAALARERGIPAVLGVRGATLHIPDGSLLVVDGNEGVVYWIPDERARSLSGSPGTSSAQRGESKGCCRPRSDAEGLRGAVLRRDDWDEHVRSQIRADVERVLTAEDLRRAVTRIIV